MTSQRKFNDTKMFRVDHELWDQAAVKANRDGTTVSALIRHWLRQYVSDMPVGGD